MQLPTTSMSHPAMETRRKALVQAVSEERALSFFSNSQSSWVVFDPQPVDILSYSTKHPLTETESEADAEQPAVGGDETQHALSYRIDEWQNATESAVSENAASWDLDEDLVRASDTSAMGQVPALYGNELFANMSQAEFLRFRRSSAILRSSLTRSGFNASDPLLLSRLMTLLRWKDLLKCSASLVDDYVYNMVSRSHFCRSADEASETATSSLMVMCGGNSWNDL